jgi:hypothetical protein
MNLLNNTLMTKRVVAAAVRRSATTQASSYWCASPKRLTEG